MSSKNTRVLVLTSATGGGHDMRARSLLAWSKTPEGREVGLDVSIYQTLENLTGIYKFGVDLYNWIQLKAPWFHHVYFNFLERASLHSKASRISEEAQKRFVARLKEEAPDVIVSTHAHLNHGFFELARQALPKVKVATYCGELFSGYGFSRHWVNPKVDAFFGAVNECCDAARMHWIPEGRNHLGGFMLNPVFWRNLPDQESRQHWLAEHGLDPWGFTLLLATGANSANNHMTLLNALNEAKFWKLQVVALCGSNKEAKAAVEHWAKHHPAFTVRALGRLESDEMRQAICSSSCMVARPGTGTTSEAILCGCPIIHNGIGGIMPQEWITVKFMASHGQKRVMTKPSQLPELLQPLLDKTALKEAKDGMLALRPDSHPLKVLRWLKGLHSTK